MCCLKGKIMQFKHIIWLMMLGFVAACGGLQPQNAQAKPALSSTSSVLWLPADGFGVQQPPSQYHAKIRQIIQYTNQLRAEKGLPALKYNANLAAHAQRRAEEVVGRFDLNHYRPDGNITWNQGIVGNAGENLAGGDESAQKTVLQQWRNSPSHYANIINPIYTQIGVGLVYVTGSKYGYHWVQIFGDDKTKSQYSFDLSPTAQQHRLLAVSANITTAKPSEAVNWLWVGSKQIPVNKSANDSWLTFLHEQDLVRINGYANTRFGVIKTGNGRQKVYYFGKNTDYENMPQSGSGSYKGKAVLVNQQAVQTDDLSIQIQSHLGQKKLVGALFAGKQKIMDLDLNVRGTSFHSPAHSVVEIQGAFFGKRGDELGGVFYDHRTGWYGAFGAKR